MTVDAIVDLARDASLQILFLAGPPLLVALMVGTAVGFFQAITSVQDATISLVPKIAAVFFTLALMLPWLLERLLLFSSRMFGELPMTVLGG